MSAQTAVPVRSALIEFAARRPHWLLLGVLLLLHMAVLQGVSTSVGRTVFTGHVGLFLIWQPIVHGERRLSAVESLIMAAVLVAAIAWASPWLILIWVALLTGILGGKVLYSPAAAARLFYLLALGYLVAFQLLLVLPQVLPLGQAVPEAFDIVARYVLPAVLLLMALLPVERAAEGEPEVIDLIYSAFVFLLIAALVLGAIATMHITGKGYGESLLYSLVGVSAILFLLGWAWNPRAGFSGLGLLLSRYVLSRGAPFDEWLHRLTESALREQHPERFVAAACEQLLRVPGVAGGRWSARGAGAAFGADGAAHQEFSHEALTVRLHAREAFSPALLWHVDVLVKLIGEFHVAKVRAEQLQQLSYLQAVHETGARLTHDVKNLLQSLNALCFAAAEAEQQGRSEFGALLARQLPAIAQRLQQTLDKLRRPAGEAAEAVPAQQWWDDLRRRYAQAPVRFSAAVIAQRSTLPAAVFNSVAENLLQNALAKLQRAQATAVEVDFEAADRPRLAVCDDGVALPAELARRILQAPVSSEDGLGIGLFQAARLAEAAGYELKLESNRDGRVCFTLEAVAAARELAA